MNADTLKQRIAELEELEMRALVQLAEIRGAKAEARRVLTEIEKNISTEMRADNVSLQ